MLQQGNGSEWGREKDGNSTPTGKVVWWRCQKNHFWKEGFEKCTDRKGSGDPACAKRTRNLCEKGVAATSFVDAGIRSAMTSEMSALSVKAAFANKKVWWRPISNLAERSPK